MVATFIAASCTLCSSRSCKADKTAADADDDDDGGQKDADKVRKGCN